MKNYTITIGIPAYNEEANIKFLLDTLLGQTQRDWTLSKIIVYSDASTDRTNEIVTSLKNNSIDFRIGRTRIGMMAVENEIIKTVDTDILIFINADTNPQDSNFISELVDAFRDDATDLVSCKIIPLKADRVLERVLEFSHYFKTSIYEQMLGKNSVYLCHGRLKALHKRFYKDLVIPNVMAEDAYTYLECLRRGLKFKYVDKTELYFRSPTTLKDYLRQSTRFTSSVSELITLFPELDIKSQFRIPFSLIFREFFKHNIFSVVSYFVLLGFSKISSYLKPVKSTHLWESIESSKKLISERTKKRIDVITEYFYPVAAGIEMNTFQTYKILAENGWEIRIHTKKDSLIQKNVYSDIEFIDGLKIFRYKSNFLGFFPNIDYFNVEVIALHNFNIFPHLSILLKTIVLKLLGKKKYMLFLTPHGGYTPEWKVFGPLLRICKWVYHFTIGKLLIFLCVDGLRAVSDWEKAELVKKGLLAEKITVISNGLENIAYMDNLEDTSVSIKNAVAQYSRYFIQIGRIFPIKNYETSIRAMVLLPSDIKLVIVGPVGDERYYARLLKLVKNLLLESRVIFHGVATDQDKYYLIKNSIAFVHLAIWESFCNVVNEAMSQGKVCVVANNTALPYLVKDNINGFCVSTYNPKQVAEKLNYILKVENEPTIKRIANENINFTENNSWVSVAQKMHSLYLSLLNQWEVAGRYVVNNIIKKYSQIFSISLILLLAFAVLLVNIRGFKGNPSVADLNSSMWKENGPFELSPERGRFALTYSIIEDKSFNFSLPVARFATPDLGIKNGNYVSLFAPGVSFLAIPTYLIGKSYGFAQVGAVSIVAIFALLNVLLILKICDSLGIGKFTGLLSGLIFLFATPAFSYSLSLYQHHISVFLILLSLIIYLSKHNYWKYSLFWFVVFCSFPIDYPNIFLLLPLILVMFSKFFGFVINDSRIVFKIKYLLGLSTLSILIPLIFFVWFNKNSYGTYFQLASTVGNVQAINSEGKPFDPKTKSESSVNPELRKRSATSFFKTRNILNGLNVLVFSKDRGTLFFTPVMFMGVLGLYFIYQRNNQLFAILFGIIIMNILIYSMRSDVYGGWAFGSRYLIPAYSILSICIGYAFFSIGTFWRRLLFVLIFLTLLSYSTYVNTLGALTTNSIPPRVEVLRLEELSGRQEKYSYDRNIDHINSGKIKAVGYQSNFKRYFNPWEYFNIIYITVLTLIAVTMIPILFRRSK